MKQIPLTRVRHATNFSAALQEIGAPVDRILYQSGLDCETLDNIGSDGIISALSMLDYAEKAANHTGIFDLGCYAGTMPIESYGNFGRRVASAPTLHNAVTTFCREVHTECSEADYFLTLGKSSAWFCHGPVPGGTTQQTQHELYAVMIIIQVIQLALGKQWLPQRIRLQASDESAARMNEALLKTTIEFGAPITAVEFPLKHLASPLLHDARSTDFQYIDTSTGCIEFPKEQVPALKALIELQISQSRQPSIDIAAEMAGVSKRTLQRFLSEQATSYSSLLDEVRMEMALSLLRDPTQSITDIAVGLGYANIAHFSRAFKRMTGLSPKGYRKQLLD
jgi:AraC-like DNA-binding protein